MEDETSPSLPIAEGNCPICGGEVELTPAGGGAVGAMISTAQYARCTACLSSFCEVQGHTGGFRLHECRANWARLLDTHGNMLQVFEEYRSDRKRLKAGKAELVAALKDLRACISETRGRDATKAVEAADAALAKAEGE